LRDLGTERLTWGDLVRVTQHLPPESATVRAIVQHYRHGDTEPDQPGEENNRDWDAREIDELKAILAAPRIAEQPHPDGAPVA